MTTLTATVLPAGAGESRAESTGLPSTVTEATPCCTPRGFSTVM